MPLLRLGYRDRVIPAETIPLFGGTKPIYTGIREGSWTYTRLRNRQVRPARSSTTAPPTRSSCTTWPAGPRYAEQLKRYRALDAKSRDCAGATCPRPSPSRAKMKPAQARR